MSSRTSPTASRPASKAATAAAKAVSFPRGAGRAGSPLARTGAGVSANLMA